MYNLTKGQLCKYSKSREQRQITFDYAQTKAFICAKHKYTNFYNTLYSAPCTSVRRFSQ